MNRQGRGQTRGGGGGRNMLGILSTGWLRLGPGDHQEDVDRARTPTGQAGARGEMCPEGPLLENQKLGQLQTGTHHLRAADGVESARDSTPATRPDVVLKLTGLGSTRPASAPAAQPCSPDQARVRARVPGPTPPASAHSGQTKPSKVLPKLQGTHTFMLTRTRANSATCVLEASTG